MKRLISLMMVLTLCISIFAGCGKSAEENQATEQSADKAGKTDKDTGKSAEDKADDNKDAEPEEVELVCYLEKWGSTPAFQTALEAFQVEYPHIKIKLEETSDYETKVAIASAAGEAIDVIAVKNPIQFVNWMDVGILSPLNQYAQNAGYSFEDEFGVNAIPANVDGDHYYFPWTRTVWQMVYNKQIFDEAGIAYPSSTEPMTWSEYRALAKQLTSGEGQDKIFGTYHLNWPTYWYGQAIQQLGGGEHFYTKDGLSNIEAPEFREALQYAYDMQHVDQSMPTYADVATQKIKGQAFLSGDYGMHIIGSWVIGWLGDQEMYPRDWEAGIAPLPVPDNETEKVTWGVVGGFAIPKSSAHPEEAFIFLDYITSNAPQLVTNQIFAHKNAVPENLSQVLADSIDEGITAEMIEACILDEDAVFVTEKVTGDSAKPYETIIKEEVEMFFVDIQDLDTTIANIKKRADELLTGN